MSKEAMELIAARAAELAIKVTAEEVTDLTYDECYSEYMDQLQSNDCQYLRTWIGSQIGEGVQEAVEIMKMMIRGSMRGGRQCRKKQSWNS